MKTEIKTLLSLGIGAAGIFSGVIYTFRKGMEFQENIDISTIEDVCNEMGIMDQFNQGMKRILSQKKK